MKLDNLTEAIQLNKINITRHARQEAKNDLLTLDDILFSTDNGEIIASYPDDKPYPSCLIYGNTSMNAPFLLNTFTNLAKNKFEAWSARLPCTTSGLVQGNLVLLLKINCSNCEGVEYHSVWAYDSVNHIAILITVYRPDPNLWINWKERRK